MEYAARGVRAYLNTFIPIEPHLQLLVNNLNSMDSFGTFAVLIYSPFFRPPIRGPLFTSNNNPFFKLPVEIGRQDINTR